MLKNQESIKKKKEKKKKERNVWRNVRSGGDSSEGKKGSSLLLIKFSGGVEA